MSLKIPNADACDIHIKPFAPTPQLLDGIRNGSIDSVEYAKAYLALLESRENAFKAADKLKKMNNAGSNVVLLCWEASGFCHRQLLAQWLNVGWNLNVVELTKPM